MVIISLEWTTAKWLLQGLVTSLLSGVGFLFITIALEYVKKYCRDKKQREKARILQRILRGEEVMQWTEDKAMVLVPKGRALGRGDTLSRASMLFNNYKHKGGFLGFGRGYYGNPSREAMSGFGAELERLQAGILDFPEWSNLDLGSVKPSGREEPEEGKNGSFKGKAADSPTASASMTMKHGTLGRQKAPKMSGGNAGPKLWSQQQQRQATDGDDQEKSSVSPLSKKLCEDMYRRLVDEYPFIAPYLKRNVMEEIEAKIAAAESKEYSDSAMSDTSKSCPRPPRNAHHKPVRSLRKRIRSDLKRCSTVESAKNEEKRVSVEGSSVDDLIYTVTSPITISPSMSPMAWSNKKGLNYPIAAKITSKTSKCELGILRKNLGSKSQPLMHSVESTTHVNGNKRSRSASLGHGDSGRLAEKKKPPGQTHGKTAAKEKPVKSKEPAPSVTQSEIREFGTSVDDDSVTVVTEKPVAVKTPVDVGFIVLDKRASVKQSNTDVFEESRSSDIFLAFEKAAKVNNLERVPKCEEQNNVFENKKSRNVSFVRTASSKSPRKGRKKSGPSEVKAKVMKKRVSTPVVNAGSEVDPPFHPHPQATPRANVKRSLFQKKPRTPVGETQPAWSPNKLDKRRGRSPQKGRKSNRQVPTVRKSLPFEAKVNSKLPFPSVKATAPREKIANWIPKVVDPERQTGKKLLFASSPEKSSSKNRGAKKPERSMKTAEKSPEFKAQREKPTEKKKERPQKLKEAKHGDPLYLSSTESEVSPALKQRQLRKFVKSQREKLERSDSDRSPGPFRSPPHTGLLKRKMASKKTPETPQPLTQITPKDQALGDVKITARAQHKAKRKYSKGHGKRDSHTPLKSPRSLSRSKSRKSHGGHSLRESKDLIMDDEPAYIDGDEDEEEDDGEEEQADSTNQPEGMKTISDYKVKVSQRRLLDTIGPIVTYHPKKKQKSTRKKDASGTNRQLSEAESQGHSPGPSDAGTTTPESPWGVKVAGGETREVRSHAQSRSSTRRTSPRNLGSGDTGSVDNFKRRDTDGQSTDEIHIRVLPAVDSSKNAQEHSKEHRKPVLESQHPPLTAEKGVEASNASTRTSDTCCGRLVNPSGDSKSSSRPATYSCTGSMYTASSRRSTPLEDISECLTESIKSSSLSDTCDYLKVSSKCELQPVATTRSSLRKNSPRTNFSPRPGSRHESLRASPASAKNNSGNGLAEDDSQSCPMLLKRSALDDVVKAIQRPSAHRFTPSPTLNKPTVAQGYAGQICVSPHREESIATSPSRPRLSSSSRRSLPVTSPVRVTSGLEPQLEDTDLAKNWSDDHAEQHSQAASHRSAFHVLESGGSSQHRLDVTGSRHSSVGSLRKQEPTSPTVMFGVRSRSGQASPARSLFGSRASFPVESFESASVNGNHDPFDQVCNLRADPWDYKGKPFQEYRVGRQPQDED